MLLLLERNWNEMSFGVQKLVHLLALKYEFDIDNTDYMIPTDCTHQVKKANWFAEDNIFHLA